MAWTRPPTGSALWPCRKLEQGPGRVKTRKPRSQMCEDIDGFAASLEGKAMAAD